MLSNCFQNALLQGQMKNGPCPPLCHLQHQKPPDLLVMVQPMLHTPWDHAWKPSVDCPLGWFQQWWITVSCSYMPYPGGPWWDSCSFPRIQEALTETPSRGCCPTSGRQCQGTVSRTPKSPPVQQSPMICALFAGCYFQTDNFQCMYGKQYYPRRSSRTFWDKPLKVFSYSTPLARIHGLLYLAHGNISGAEIQQKRHHPLPKREKNYILSILHIFYFFFLLQLKLYEYIYLFFFFFRRVHIFKFRFTYLQDIHRLRTYIVSASVRARFQILLACYYQQIYPLYRTKPILTKLSSSK